MPVSAQHNRQRRDEREDMLTLSSSDVMQSGQPIIDQHELRRRGAWGRASGFPK